MTCKQYKPNILVLICNTDSIKDNKIHEGDPNEAEHRFNWETYTPSAGVAGMLLHIYGKFTTWKLKLSLIKKVLFKLWSRYSCILWYLLVQVQGNRCNQNSQYTLNYSVNKYNLYSAIKKQGYLHLFWTFLTTSVNYLCIILTYLTFCSFVYNIDMCNLSTTCA
jgi:hypothetical protein